MRYMPALCKAVDRALSSSAVPKWELSLHMSVVSAEHVRGRAWSGAHKYNETPHLGPNSLRNRSESALVKERVVLDSKIGLP
jgi:hypothetical protein